MKLERAKYTPQGMPQVNFYPTLERHSAPLNSSQNLLIYCVTGGTNVLFPAWFLGFHFMTYQFHVMTD